MLKRLKSLYREERGLTTVEWAILVGLVAAIAIAGGIVIRGGVGTAAGVVNNKLQGAVANAGTTNSW
jgi:Flp pilus assembly pilin Flp